MIGVQEQIDFLKGISIFSKFSPEALTELVKLLVRVEFPAGHCIFEHGDVGDCMFIIEDGLVKVHIGDKIFNCLGSGCFFGEIAALDTETRSASVTTLQPSSLWKLDQAGLYHLMEVRPEVRHGIIQRLSTTLRERTASSFEDFQYMEQFRKITAAAVNLEAGIYDEASLDEVTLRQDELGHLARVFQQMVREVQRREQQLKQQLQELQIEIDHSRLAQHVNQIVESESFNDLRATAQTFRNKRQRLSS